MPFSKLESKDLAHSSFVWHPNSLAKGTKFSGISLSAKASWKEKTATSREASQKNFLKLSIFIILFSHPLLFGERIKGVFGFVKRIGFHSLQWIADLERIGRFGRILYRFFGRFFLLSLNVGRGRLITLVVSFGTAVPIPSDGADNKQSYRYCRKIFVHIYKVQRKLNKN